VTRHSGVESCSSGVHLDAGHHTTLAPVVSIAKIVQEVKAGTHKATQDLNPSVQLPERAPQSAHSSICGWNGLCRPAASSRLRLAAESEIIGPQTPYAPVPPTTAADRTLSLATRFPTASWLTA